MIYRPELEVIIAPLNEAEHLFLNLLDRKSTLTQAVEQVITKDSIFDVQKSLQRWITNGLFIDFFINN